MSTLLLPHAYLGHLRCPCGARGELVIQEGAVGCHACHRQFGITSDGILDWVQEAELDAETAREFHAHAFALTGQQIAKRLLKEKASLWKSYYSRNRRRSIETLAAFLEHVDCSRIAFLGAGTGREIEYLLSFREFRTVFCSDLSPGALRLVPARLAEFDIELGLFTADLQRCPLECREMPVVVVNALHHTRDMHATLEHLLGRRCENLFLVEPTDNFAIRLFARLGWARRQEYSGVVPGRLELPRVKALCERHGYRVKLQTHWEFPHDYYRKLFGDSGRGQAFFFRLLDGFSSLTKPMRFGNFSVIHLSLEAASARQGGDPEGR